MQPKQIGELTEQIVITELLRNSIPVSKPIGDNQEYDIIMEYKDKLLKAQIRTAQLLNGVLICRLQSVRMNSKGFYVKRLSNIDLFLFYCYTNNKIYVINKDIENKNKVLLRIECPTNNQHRKIRFASDYALDKFIDN